MQVSLVISNNQQDILNTQMDFVQKSLSNQHKQLLIVPDKFSLNMEEYVFEKLNIQASFDIDVCSLAKLSSKYVDNGNKRILSSLGATMIIQMLINKYKDELVCFVNTTKNVTFASVLFDSISQLKSCDVSYVDLRNSADKQQDLALRNKMLDIALIYEKYEEYIKNDYIDSNNRLKLLCEKISENNDLCNTDVYFCNFNHLTKLGYNVISSFVKKANSVTIGIIKPNAKQNNRDMFNDENFDKIYEICKNVNITPNIIEINNADDNKKQHLVQNIFAYKTDVMQNENFIQLYEAGNPVSEVEFVVKDILRRIRTQNIRYKDININCVDLYSYAPILKEKFMQYGISSWIDLPFELRNTEVCKFLLHIFDSIAKGFKAENILYLIKSPVLNINNSTQELMERIIYRYGLDYDLIFTKLSGLDDDSEYVEFCQAVENNLHFILDFRQSITESVTAGQYVFAIRQLFETLSIDNVIDNMINQNVLDNDLINQSINRQSLTRINKVLDEINEIMAEYALSFDDVILILQAGISSETISPLAMSLDCVYVGQSLQSMYRDRPIMYVLGASEGKFPAWMGDVGLITDSDIQYLESEKVKISPSIKELNRRSKETILTELSTAMNELIISYPIVSGNEKNAPSTIMNDLSKIFKISENDLPIYNIEYVCENVDDAFGGMQNRLLFNWGNYSNMLQDIIRIGDKDEFYATAKKCLIETNLIDIFKHISNISTQHTIDFDIALKLFFSKGKVSVTELETYFNCPYIHFLQYGLKLRQDKTTEIDSLDIGTIIHSVLENYTKILRKYGHINEDKIQDIAVDIFSNVMQDNDYIRFVATNKNAQMIESLKNECVRICKAISYQQDNSKYEIKFIESSFGDNGFVKIPEIAILNNNLNIKIKGKIDRVDCYNGKYRIIDYKTSKNASKFSLVNFYIGKKIQLFYYAYAMLKGLKDQGIDASMGGAYYLPIHREFTDKEQGQFENYRMNGIALKEYDNLIAQDKKVCLDNPKSDIIDFSISTNKEYVMANDPTHIKEDKQNLANADQFYKLLDYSEKIITKAIIELSQGYIMPKPIKNACEYCEYKNICRIKCSDVQRARTDEYDIDVEGFGGIE